MKPIKQFLDALNELDVKFWAEGDKLGCDAPKGVLTSSLQQEIVARKEEILALLQITQPLPQVKAAPTSRYDPFPLTDVQYAYWMGRHQHFELGNMSTQGYVELEANEFDISALNQAWQKLIDRHEMLRTVVRSDGQQQILADIPSYEIAFLDLSEADPATVEQELATIRQEMTTYVFQAEEWPLFDIRVTRLKGKSYLHICIDMLIVDDSSMDILFQEWSKLYREPEVALPPLTLSFRDYVLTLKEIEKTALYEESKQYWLDRLETLPPAPKLPFALDPKTIKAPRFQTDTYYLTATLWQQLQERVKDYNIQASTLLLAAFAEVLTGWSKSPHFTINMTLFNRLPLHPQVNEIVGDFTSISLVEVDNRANDNDTFIDRVNRIQTQLWQDLDHYYFSGVAVIQHLSRLQQQRNVAVMPIVFTNILGVNGDSEKLLGEAVYGLGQTSQVYLDYVIIESEAGLSLFLHTVKTLFPADLVDDMACSYMALLKALATDDALWHSTHPRVLPVKQWEERLVVNDTEAPISDALLHTLFIDQVEQRPNNVAVISGNKILTYQDLYQQARGVGHWLREQGATPNQLVAVVMEKGWEQVVAVMGILFSGAAYLPIDPELPAERQHYLLEQGDVQLVLTQPHLNAHLSWPNAIQRLVVDPKTMTSLPSKTPLDIVQSPTDLAYVIYTSGSTGKPKGVVIDHRGAVNTILDINRRFKVTEKDRVLALSALNFDLSVYDIFGLLAVGGAIVMPAPDGRRDPSHWVELMTEQKVTLWDTVPALMHMLVMYQVERPLNIPLRLVMMSGDWIPLDLPDRIGQLWPEATLMSLGGATEASIWSIYYPIETVEPTWRSIPYGKPLTNQTFHVLNKRLDPCPVWVPGHLYIGGIGLALGYWQDEEKTKASFFTHPRTGERLYKTGDLGRYLPDGNIEFLGREDFQVKIRGHRIELGEIEANLLKHPDIKEVIVSAMGESRHDKQLVAYIVPTTSTESTAPAKNGNHAHPGSILNEVDGDILNNVEGQNGKMTDETQPIDQAAYGLQVMQGVLTDPMTRLQFKLNQHGIRQFENDLSRIPLPAAEVDDPAYVARQSYRQFVAEPITLSQLGELLNCLSPRPYPHSILPKYRYGSAGSLYPIQTYLYVKPDRVANLAGGLYYYHPVAHDLIMLSATTSLNRDHHGGTNQTIFDQSAFSLFLVAEYQAIEPMYGTAARDFCLLEAGYMSQLLMMESPDYEVGLCPIGGMDFESLRAEFGLSDSQEMIHSFLGGGITTEQKQTLFQGTPSAQTTNSSSESPTSLEDALKVYLGQKLPDYMVPHIYIQLPELPLTANGKVDRKALPQPDLNKHWSEFVAPKSDLEHRLVELVQQQFEVASISLTDDFFDLGVNSLDIIQLYNTIKITLHQEISIVDIFNYPTIQGLAEQLSQAPTTIVETSPSAIPTTSLTSKEAELLSVNIDHLTEAEVEQLLATLEQQE